jgi:hypothetical protein
MKVVTGMIYKLSWIKICEIYILCSSFRSLMVSIYINLVISKSCNFYKIQIAKMIKVDVCVCPCLDSAP